MKRPSFVIVLLLFVVVFALPTSASADVAGTVTKFLFGLAAAPIYGGVILATAVVGYIAAIFSGLLLSGGGLIAGAASSMQAFIVSDSNTIVTVGWTIVRDIANLGFVLVIIVIAFATILRLENYGAKKLLPRLIMAAILVNFSLQIGASIIGFSQVITDFFFTKISLSPGDIGATLLGAFGPQKFLAGAQDPSGVVTEGVAIAVNLVVGPWLITIFNLIMLFTILVLAFMLLIRFLALSFLLVIAPITWLFFVIPALQGQFSKWWGKFLQWTFFAPATSFFLYLSFTTAQGLDKLWKGKGEATLTGLDAVFQSIFRDGMNVILLSGFLIGGLIVAQQMSITGAAGAMGLMQKFGKGVKERAGKWAGRQTKQVGARALESKFGTATAGFLQRIPGLKRAGMALGGRAEIMRRELVEDAGKRLNKYGDAHLAKNLDALSAPERVAAMERLAKNGTTNLIKDKDGNGNVLNNVTGENKKRFENYYGEGSRQWKEFELSAGMNVASADAIRKGPAGKTELNEEMKKWLSGLTPDKIAKLPTNDIFNDKETIESFGPAATKEMSDMFREALVHGVVTSKTPNDLAKLFSKIKPSGFEKLHSTATRVGADLRDSGNRELSDKIVDILEKIPSLRFYSGMYEGDGGAKPAAPTAPPPQPPPKP
ncbi:MAG: hypothetical protein V1656_01285 [Candidatus Jorgensenbacteria bacterium]